MEFSNDELQIFRWALICRIKYLKENRDRSRPDDPTFKHIDDAIGAVEALSVRLREESLRNQGVMPLSKPR